LSNLGLSAPSPVLVDTDVFSRVFVATGTSAEGQRWSSALAGRTITIAVQTEVELRAWPLLKRWGSKRTAALEQQLASIGTIQVTSPVQAKFIELTVWAKATGHAIQDKAHTADRWIAATAIAYDLEIAAGDGIYSDVKDLRRLKGIP
jgi:predicted nucleic acid-binding protein